MHITRELRRGTQGEDVTRLQRELQRLGLYREGIDDTFGPATETAGRDRSDGSRR